MRESRSYGSVGVRGGNEPLYPEIRDLGFLIDHGFNVRLTYHITSIEGTDHRLLLRDHQQDDSVLTDY